MPDAFISQQLTWSGEAITSPQDPFAAIAQELTWSGEAITQPEKTTSAAPIVQGLTWSGEPVTQADAVSADAFITQQSTWSGEPAHKVPLEQQQIVPGGIGNGSIAISGEGGSILVPFSGDHDIEEIINRGSVEQTFDGVGFYDGGNYDVDRRFRVVIPDATREQVDTMKALVRGRIVTVSHWDGTFVCWFERMNVSKGELQADFKTISKPS